MYKCGIQIHSMIGGDVRGAGHKIEQESLTRAELVCIWVCASACHSVCSRVLVLRVHVRELPAAIQRQTVQGHRDSLA